MDSVSSALGWRKYEGRLSGGVSQVRKGNQVSLYTCLCKALLAVWGRLSIDNRVFPRPNVLLLYPSSPFTVPFLWIMFLENTCFSLRFWPGDVSEQICSIIGDQTLCSERDFPSSYLLKRGTSLQEQPETGLVLSLAKPFTIFPLLSAYSLHGLAPASRKPFLIPLSLLLWDSSHTSFPSAPFGPDGSWPRGFATCSFPSWSCSPALVSEWLFQVPARESLCWPPWSGQVPWI